MEFRDLKKQYLALQPAIDQAIASTVASGRFIMGEAVQQLETQLSSYVGVRHGLTCASGTDALTLALKTWNIGPGDAVFVPDFTFFASAEAVAAEGATPIFVDVCADTFNISATSLAEAIDRVIKEGKLTPKAIVAVDLFGLPADYLTLRTIADKYGLLILEDAAQGFGGSIGNRRACSFGDIAITSFFPAKPLGCYGDGGALFTNNDGWAEKIKSLRQHGKGTNKYDNVRLGLNSRLDTLQAAILQIKLNAFNKELTQVQAIADQYNKLLSDIEGIHTPHIPDSFQSSWAQYTIRLSDAKQREKLQQYLFLQGIPTMIYYPKAMSQQTAFNLLAPIVKTTMAQRLTTEVLSLPFHPYLSQEEIQAITTAIRKALQ